MLNTLFCGGNTGVLQQGNRTLARFSIAHRQMRLNGLDQLSTHRIQRVQRGQRVLKNGAYLAAPDVPHVFIAQVVNTLALQQDLPTADTSRRFQQPNDGGAGERFSSPRFSDDAKNFTGRNFK